MPEIEFTVPLIGQLVSQYSARFCELPIDEHHAAWPRYSARVSNALGSHARAFAVQGILDPQAVVSALEVGRRFKWDAGGGFTLVNTGSNIIEDLVLAQACVEREPRAIREFRLRYELAAIDYAGKFASSVKGSLFEIENLDLCQFLLEVNTTSKAKRTTPKIDDYDGQISLRNYFFMILFGLKLPNGTHSFERCRYRDWADAASRGPRIISLSDSPVDHPEKSLPMKCEGCEHQAFEVCFRSGIRHVFSRFQVEHDRCLLVYKTLHPTASQRNLADCLACSESLLSRAWDRIRAWLHEQTPAVRKNSCVEHLLRGDSDAWSLLREEIRRADPAVSSRIDDWAVSTLSGEEK